MFETFGAVVTGQQVEFRLFFPNQTLFTNGADPQIKEIRIRGDFQSEIGGTDWDFTTALVMTRQDMVCRDIGMDFVPDPTGTTIGTLYTATIPALPDGFYQYKYYPTFADDTERWCSDPCTKLTGDSDFENSAFVVGGNATSVNPVQRRLPFTDMLIYELMVDDFTAQFRGTRAPVDAVADKLGYVLGLGVNTIELMPVMGVPTNIPPCADNFDWGYIPNWPFAVENRYVEDLSSPLDRLFKLKQLINSLHATNTHVIFDGVFNHVAPQVTGPNKGFPYHWLYMNPSASPFTGGFADTFGDLEDLDYNNRCTELYILDVCKYWLDTFQFDGIRFDFTKGFLNRARPDLGITKLVTDLKTYLAQTGRGSIPMILEDINGFQAIDDTNFVCAAGNWFDEWLTKNSQYMNGTIDAEALRIFNANFDYATGKSPVTYIDNHDHSTITQRAGGRAARWFKTQPPAIALFACPGVPMIRNGQEFGEEYFLPDDDRFLPCDQKRVQPRPLRWDTLSDDGIGTGLYSIYKALIQIRATHSSLRSSNFFPEDNQNHDGYGVFPGQNTIIFHRYGQGFDGSLERFIVVINYSDADQTLDVPVSDNGTWTDLLNGVSFTVSGFRLPGLRIPSNWGRILFRRN